MLKLSRLNIVLLVAAPLKSNLNRKEEKTMQSSCVFLKRCQGGFAFALQMIKEYVKIKKRK